MSKTKGTEKKKQLFGAFLNQWRSAHAKLHPTDAESTVSIGISCSMYVHKTSKGINDIEGVDTGENEPFFLAAAL